MLWIKDAVLGLVAQYGVAALFVGLTLETLGLPLPGEAALIGMSAAAGAGQGSIWHVAVAAFAGAVLGDNIGYLIGRRYGRVVILRHGSRIGITEDKYRKAEDIASKYGPLMVVVARFIVLLRQINGLVAGSTGMHWVTFLVSNMIGAGLWVGFWTTLAYRFGHSPSILPYLWHHLALIGMIVVPFVLLVVLIAYVRMKRRGGMPS